jgi:hypothetical protein
MSRIYKKKYNSYNREILEMFLNKKDLKALDYAYNRAKIIRTINRALKATK